jgi:hypothetical protein
MGAIAPVYHQVLSPVLQLVAYKAGQRGYPDANKVKMIAGRIDKAGKAAVIRTTVVDALGGSMSEALAYWYKANGLEHPLAPCMVTMGAAIVALGSAGAMAGPDGFQLAPPGDIDTLRIDAPATAPAPDAAS